MVADDHNDATLPPEGSQTERDGLSRGGQLLFSSLEQRMFGQSDVQKLGRYHLIDTLGRGAMGIVYRAYDPDLDRRVAIKVVSVDGAEARARMVREAKALAKLNHPNVVTVHEVGEDGEDLFVVMEYVDGGSLVDWIRAHPFGEAGRTRQLVEFLLQALEGLAAAHELGLVHRDIKPANLLVGGDGRLRVADFGLARGVQDDVESTVPDEVSLELSSSATLTRDGQIVGTPAFMAPEQFRGVADARSDQFSMAVTFYLALYDKRPFESDALVGLLDAIENERVANSPSGDVPDFVRQVLLRAMRAKPRDRFSSVEEMGRAVRAGGRRRRRIIGVVGAGAAALGLAGVSWASAPKPCRDERDRIEAVVSEHTGRIERLALESGRPHPEEVVGRFSFEIDRLIDNWSAQRLDACRAARVDEPEQAALAERRLVCLDEGLDAVESSLASIQTLTPVQADALPNVAILLIGAVDCKDPDRVFAEERGRELVATFRAGRLAENQLDHSRARELYESILSKTKPGEFPDLRAEVHTRVAALAEAADEHATFQHHILASLREAQRSGDPEFLSLGWLQVAETLPPETSEDVVELFIELSQAAREGGEISDFMEANIAYREASLRFHRREFDEALTLLRAAEEPAKRASSFILGYLYHMESSIVHRTGDLDTAESRAEDAVTTLASRLGDHHPDVAGMRMHLADIQSWQGKDEQAIATFDRVIEVLEERPDYMVGNLLSAISGRGDTKRNVGRLEEALEDYAKAIELARSIPGQERRVFGFQTAKARALWMMGRPEEGLELATSVARELDPQTVFERDTRANASILRAHILAELDRADDARRELETAVTWVDDAYGSDGVTRVQAGIQLAEVWVELGDYERCHREVDRFLPQTKDEPMWRSMLQRVKAQALHGQGELAQARLWAERALASMKASNAGEHEYVPIRELLAMLEEL